jgi:hypothetical protein
VIECVRLKLSYMHHILFMGNLCFTSIVLGVQVQEEHLIEFMTRTAQRKIKHSYLDTRATLTYR